MPFGRQRPVKSGGMLFRDVFGDAASLSGHSPKLLRRETMVGGTSDSVLEEGGAGSRIVSTPDFLDYYPVVLADVRTRAGGNQIAPPITLPRSL